MNTNVTWRSAHAAETSPTTAIVVNGEAVQVGARTLSDLLIELGYGEAKVATALNGDFVPTPRRSETAVQAGDRVEVVAPRQGG